MARVASRTRGQERAGRALWRQGRPLAPGPRSGDTDHEPRTAESDVMRIEAEAVGPRIRDRAARLRSGSSDDRGKRWKRVRSRQPNPWPAPLLVRSRLKERRGGKPAGRSPRNTRKRTGRGHTGSRPRGACAAGSSTRATASWRQRCGSTQDRAEGAVTSSRPSTRRRGGRCYSTRPLARPGAGVTTFDRAARS